MAIVQEQITANHFTANTPTWIAVIGHDGKAKIQECMDTICIWEIVEGESKEELIAAMAARGITVNEEKTA